MRHMTGLNELRDQGKMAWIQEEHGGLAAPDEIVQALSKDRFAEGKRAMPSRVLARMATTGIYLLRGVPRDLQRTARVRAVHEGTTLRSVLVQALREYAAGTWTPQPHDKSPQSAHDQCR
jgi:hypothetical protein